MPKLADVLKELAAMKAVGMKVPAKALKMTEETYKSLTEYCDNMSVSETADMIIDLI